MNTTPDIIKYKINELFETIQGEGSFTGQPSIFIRLQGCPVGCSWCDTKHTWEVELSDEVSHEKMLAKTNETPLWASFTAEDILALVREKFYQAKHIVITGGEPCMYDLRPLCELFEQEGYSAQIETSGTFDLDSEIEIYVSELGQVRFEIKGTFDLLSFNQYISEHILG